MNTKEKTFILLRQAIILKSGKEKIMPATQTAKQQDANPPTFESVWAILQEVGRKQEENAQGMIELRESQKETDRIVKETARQMKETDKRLGSLNNRFGEIVEYMIAPNLKEKFWELGLKFNIANPNTVFSEEKKYSLKLMFFCKTAIRQCWSKQKRHSPQKM